jgi:urea transport system ATP-binding protein
MIKITKLNQKYSGSQILWDISMSIPEGSRTCIMGRNGVGKTTLLKALMGLVPLSSGCIEVNNQQLDRSSIETRPNLGFGYVPQGRHIFSQLTVEENMKVSLNCQRQKNKSIPSEIFDYFPVLKQMLNRRGGDLSGGQQQQLAIARALVLNPSVLILDEPNEGIQPNIVHLIRDVLLSLNKDKNMTIILIEQKLPFARAIGEHFHLMQRGKIVSSGPIQGLSDELVSKYLSV